MPGRYLTPAEKARALQEWQRHDAITDAGARRQLEPLNKLTGVCTVQSCIGHHRGNGHVDSGHIELRLDHLATERFLDAMPALRSVRGCETVELHWRVADEQRAAVWFEPGLMPELVTALLQALAPPAAEATEGAEEDRCA